jgi:hypothetical protein
MTNDQLNTEIDSKVTTNGVKAITAAIMRPLLKLFVERLPYSIDMDLVAGPNEVTHTLGNRPSHITFWQAIPGNKVILVNYLDTYIDDATQATKFFVNAPEDMPNMKIKISL